jgi:hypothetical protein
VTVDPHEPRPLDNRAVGKKPKRQRSPETMPPSPRQKRKAEHTSRPDETNSLGNLFGSISAKTHIKSARDDPSRERPVPKLSTGYSTSTMLDPTVSGKLTVNSLAFSDLKTSDVGTCVGDTQDPYRHPSCSPQDITWDGAAISGEGFIRLHSQRCSCMREDYFTADYGYQLVTFVCGTDHKVYGAWFVRVSSSIKEGFKVGFNLSRWPAVMLHPRLYARLQSSAFNSFQTSMDGDEGKFPHGLLFFKGKCDRSKPRQRFLADAKRQYSSKGQSPPFSTERLQRMLVLAFTSADGAKRSEDAV